MARRLQAIYGPNAIAKSLEQAVALAFIHTAPRTSIVVLPIGSGKSVLFFSVAAVAIQQTVVVVVPFSALVDDIIKRGHVAGKSTRFSPSNGLTQLVYRINQGRFDV